MKKILFIIGHKPQAEMYTKIIHKLMTKNNEVKIIGINGYRLKTGVDYLIQNHINIDIITLKNYEAYIKLDTSIKKIIMSRYYLVKAYAEIKQTIMNKQPDIVIMGNDTNILAQFIIQICKNNKIKTVLIQDGIITWDFTNINFTIQGKIIAPIRKVINRFYQLICHGFVFYKLLQTKYGTGGANKIFLWGENTRRLFRNGGIPEENLFITGCSRYDNYNNTSINQIKIKKELGIKEGSTIITFAVQNLFENKFWTRTENDIYISTIIDTITKIDNVTLILKLREDVNLSMYHDIIGRSKNKDLVKLTTQDLKDIVSISDIIITTFSTVGIETVLLNKPLISFFYIGQELLPYKQYGVGYVAKSKEDLLSVINHILTKRFNDSKINDKRIRFLEDNLFLLDNNASLRIAEAILNEI